MFLIDLKLKKCDEAVDTCPFVFASVPDRYITQELWDKVFSEDPFMLKYWHDKYKTQKCVIKLLILIFVTSNMTEKLDSAIFSDDYIVFGDLVTFFLNDLITLILMKIILVIVIQKVLIILGLWIGIINLNNAKHLKKKDEKLMPVAWHPTR